jgi:hypothetical protein
LLTQKEQSFKVKGCGVGLMPNVNGAGFYRYSVDPALFTSDRFDARNLSAEDQVSLVGNEGALLSGGEHHIQELMALAGKFRGVETYGALQELSSQVHFARQYLVSADDLLPFQAWVRSVFKPALEDLGVSSPRTDTPNDLNARATLVALLGNIGEDPDAIAVAKKAVADYMKNPSSVDATLVDASIPVAAAHGNAALYDTFLAKMKVASSPQDYYRYFNALADFRDPALLSRTLDRTLTSEVRNQDLGTLLRVLRNPYGKQLAWDFIRQHYSELQHKAGQSIFGAQFAYYAVGSLCDRKSEQEAKWFLDEHAVPGLERVGRKQVEIVNQCIELRQREEPNLANYLRSTGTAAGQH